jgi:hypothetical protein
MSAGVTMFSSLDPRHAGHIILLDLVGQRACQQATLYRETAQTTSGNSGDKCHDNLTPSPGAGCNSDSIIAL